MGRAAEIGEADGSLVVVLQLFDALARALAVFRIAQDFFGIRRIVPYLGQSIACDFLDAGVLAHPVMAELRAIAHSQVIRLAFARSDRPARRQILG